MTASTKSDAPKTPDRSGKPVAGGAKLASDSGSAARVQAWSLMPQSAEARATLHERARILAGRAKQEQAQISIPYVRFRVGATQLYGIAYSNLEAITQFAIITRVPCAPPSIAGVVNYQGELLTLLDTRQLFFAEEAEHGVRTEVIVVHALGARVGLVVDEVEGNDAYLRDGLAAPLSVGGLSGADHVQGIHQGRVAILNIGALLADPAVQVDETVR